MMEKKSDEKLAKTINMIADYVIETGASTRKTAEYFKKQGFPISNFTVHSYLTKRLPEIDFERYILVKEVLHKNTPKTAEKVEVKKRIYQATSLLLQGFTVPQIVEKMNSNNPNETVSIDMIYDDLTRRLPKIEKDPQILDDVKKRLSENSLKNLKNYGMNGSEALKQPRINGTFAPIEEAKKRV